MRALRIFALFFVFFGLWFTSCSAVKSSSSKHKSTLIKGAQKTHCIEDTKLVSDLVKPIIILDAGHGGGDEGAKVGSLMEKKVTLTTTLLTKKALESLGYKVVLTRSKDVYVSLPKRVDVANRMQAVLFVSIHYNSSKNTAAEGIEIFYYDTPELWRNRASRRLANLVLHTLIDQTDAVSRGVKKGNFYVVRETSMPSILIEAGFMTNQLERKLLREKPYIEKIANGIAKGIDKYLKS